MTRRPITELSVDAAYRRLQDDRHQRFEAAMNSGAPIVDNAGHLWVIGELEYDGPRCAADDCDTAVDNDGEMCDPCGDQPHEFQHDGDPRRPDWCACGRIRAIGGYSPVHTDEGAVCSTCGGAGGWQQPDGLIVECPRGCMTGAGAA